MNIGETIRQKRRELGITQQYLSELLHIEQHTLSQYETGKRSISLEMFKEIMFAMEVVVEVNLIEIADAREILIERLNLEKKKDQIIQLMLEKEDKLPSWYIQHMGGGVFLACKDMPSVVHDKIGVWATGESVFVFNRMIANEQSKGDYDVIANEYIRVAEEHNQDIPYLEHFDTALQEILTYGENGWEPTELGGVLFDPTVLKTCADAADALDNFAETA